MTAYIEFVVIDNLLMDLLLVYITLDLLGRKKDKSRIFIACIMATGITVIVPIVSTWLARTCRFVQAPLICIIMVKWQNIRAYILNLIVFLAITFAIGGAVIALFNISNSGNSLAVSYTKGGIIGLSAFGVLLVYYTFKQLVIRYKYMPPTQSIIKVEIGYGENSTILKGFYDNGNRLYDNYGMPVIVLSSTLRGLTEQLVKGHKIKVSTVNGIREVDTYIIDKIKIYISGKEHIYSNISSIISDTKALEYDVIIHKDLL